MSLTLTLLPPSLKSIWVKTEFVVFFWCYHGLQVKHSIKWILSVSRNLAKIFFLPDSHISFSIHSNFFAHSCIRILVRNNLYGEKLNFAHNLSPPWLRRHGRAELSKSWKTNKQREGEYQHSTDISFFPFQSHMAQVNPYSSNPYLGWVT